MQSHNTERVVTIIMSSKLFKHVEHIVTNYETPKFDFEGKPYKITNLKPSERKNHINIYLKEI